MDIPSADPVRGRLSLPTYPVSCHVSMHYLSSNPASPPYLTNTHLPSPSSQNTTAHNFYAKVFNWTFKPPTTSTSTTSTTTTTTSETPDLIKFDFNPDVSLSGCVRRVPEETGILAPGRGGICLYWLVEDVEQVGSIIEDAGGKMLSGVVKESDYGLYRFFEDTEGNVGAVYQVRNS